MRKLVIVLLGLFAVISAGSGFKMSAASNMGELFSDSESYQSQMIGSSEVYLYPIWLRHADRDCWGDPWTSSMIVLNDIMYIIDGQVLVNGKFISTTIKSYDAFSGDKLDDISINFGNITTPERVNIGIDECGNAYLYTVNTVVSEKAQLNILLIDLPSGNVQEKIDLMLDNTLDYKEKNFAAVGNITVDGDLASGDFSLLVPYTIGRSFPGQTVIYEVVYRNFSMMSYQSVASIDTGVELSVTDKSISYYSPYAFRLPNGDIYLDRNTANPRFYNHATNRWSDPLPDMGTSYSSAIPQKGGHVFEFAGKQVLAGVLNQDEGYGQLYLSVLPDTPGEYLSLSRKWVLPKTPMRTMMDDKYPTAASFHNACGIMQTVSYKQQTGADISHLYFYIQGIGLGAYQLSVNPDYTASHPVVADEGQWHLDGRTLTIEGGYNTASLYTLSGCPIVTGNGASISQTLSKGVYILNIDNDPVKIIVR